MGDLYALDFDGVLCDSCGESYASSAKAAKLRWPTLFKDVDSSLDDWMVDQMRFVRPVMQARYENILLVRLLLEMRVPSIRMSSVAEGLTVEGIVENWSELKDLILKEWGEDIDALVNLYGKVRDEWKEQDLGTWIGANRLYPGVADALKSATSTIYIVTGKQSRIVEVILQELAGVTIPPDRIFGLGSSSDRKLEVLKQLQEVPEHQGLKLHFVEDRLATLKKFTEEPELVGWNLYLGDWGYNTQKQRHETATIPRIQILQLSDFCNKLNPVKRRRCGPMGPPQALEYMNLKDLRGKQKLETHSREMGDLYALDFDGVICDSCGESSLSGLKAAKVRWPALFNGVDSTLENWVLDQMRIVRPVVETGYENLLLVRLLLEMRVPSIRKSSVAEGITVEEVLEKWSELKPVIMEEWGEDRDGLIDLFGKVRDEWMDQDLETWIGANRLYPGVPDALKFASSTIYIVTTKQSRFADALLRELAGVTIPPERIFGLGSGPKVEVLKQLQKKHQGLQLHFLEDRLATLKNVIREPLLDGWKLYLGDWGYNTQKEREEAASISRIQILQLSDFSKKLK